VNDKPMEPRLADGYWCDVVAWPGDLSREIYLGGYWAKTPRLAVRWLRGQATRLTNALDPQPGVGWTRHGADGVLRRLPDVLPEGWPDPSHALRSWEEAEHAHEQTMASLLEERPFYLTTVDDSAYYLLSARPLVAAAAGGARRVEVRACRTGSTVPV
jgi:hypothetical protein